MKVGAVIVAAGMSTRMKGFKQHMKIGDLTIIERVVVNFRRAGIKDIVVVTGYCAEQVEKKLHHYGVTFLRNREYETTQMFDSAKIGLSYLQGHCDKILFCPADVPFFTEETVHALLEQEGQLVFPSCQDRLGHPIRIDCALVPLILKYQGDRGLKGALDSLDVNSVRIYVDDEGVITDADTTDDYKRLVEIHNARLMRARVKVFLMGRKAFFGPGTVTLLKQIEILGSVREACEKTGISYSKGWTIIHSAEKELGYKIVERQAGGKNGGQALVTGKGKKLLETFEDFEEKIEKTANELFRDIFLSSDLL